VKCHPPEVFALILCCEDLLASQGGSHLGAGGSNFAKDIAVFYRLDILDSLPNQVPAQKIDDPSDCFRQ
jgi:hypothetical protein